MTLDAGARKMKRRRRNIILLPTQRGGVFERIQLGLLGRGDEGGGRRNRRA